LAIGVRCEAAAETPTRARAGADGDRNLIYRGADGPGTAQSCAQAHAAARETHAQYLQTYYHGVADAARRFPLLKLRPTDWTTPFVALDESGHEIGASHSAPAF
jgi:hypothetical protein